MKLLEKSSTAHRNLFDPTPAPTAKPSRDDRTVSPRAPEPLATGHGSSIRAVDEVDGREGQGVLARLLIPLVRRLRPSGDRFIPLLPEGGPLEGSFRRWRESAASTGRDAPQDVPRAPDSPRSPGNRAA